jgi:hypothetical protein
LNHWEVRHHSYLGIVSSLVWEHHYSRFGPRDYRLVATESTSKEKKTAHCDRDHDEFHWNSSQTRCLGTHSLSCYYDCEEEILEEEMKRDQNENEDSHVTPEDCISLRSHEATESLWSSEWWLP